MGVRISRETTLGLGSKGFRFRNHGDAIADQKEYQAGRTLEEARFREGSLARKIYEHLSSDRVMVEDCTRAQKKKKRQK
jgi:hypothetical protein